MGLNYHLKNYQHIFNHGFTDDENEEIEKKKKKIYQLKNN